MSTRPCSPAREPSLSEILALFDDHARAWEPFLVARYGVDLAHAILREEHERLIPQIPYIGGDENPMTRHLVRSTTSLALYKAMSARGKTPEEAGKILHEAVRERVSHLPISPAQAPSAEEIRTKREEARRSQERRYAGDWVWELVEGDGVEFDYGYDFLECGTQKLYHAQGVAEFLPFYCALDFLTTRASGWELARTGTLAEGYERCDFRLKRRIDQIGVAPLSR